MDFYLNFQKRETDEMGTREKDKRGRRERERERERTRDRKERKRRKERGRERRKLGKLKTALPVFMVLPRQLNWVKLHERSVKRFG